MRPLSQRVEKGWRADLFTQIILLLWTRNRTMVAFEIYILCSALVGFVSASPIQERQSNSSLSPYSLPNSDDAPVIRAAGVEAKRAAFTYGPATGTGPYSPAGALGLAALAADMLVLGTEYAAQQVVTTNDSVFATANTSKVRIIIPPASSR